MLRAHKGELLQTPRSEMVGIDSLFSPILVSADDVQNVTRVHCLNNGAALLIPLELVPWYVPGQIIDLLLVLPPPVACGHFDGNLVLRARACGARAPRACAPWLSRNRETEPGVLCRHVVFCRPTFIRKECEIAFC